MIGYIYLITNTINNKQYVGQTTRTIKERFRQHCYDSKKNIFNNMYLHRAMKKYGFENFHVEEILNCQADTKNELKNLLNKYEIEYIAKYNTLSPCGYNLSPGGDLPTEYLMVKVDEYDLKGNFIITHNSLKDAMNSMNTSSNKSIVKCCQGKTTFAYQRVWRYHGDPFDLYELPDEKIAIRDHKKAPVSQYSKSGEFIQEYESASDAIRHLDEDKTVSHILEYCMGKSSTAYGYIWRYKEDNFTTNYREDKRSSKCRKYDLDGNYIATYNSINDACLSIGKDPKTANSSIAACCRNRTKTSYGYIWKYC